MFGSGGGHLDSAVVELHSVGLGHTGRALCCPTEDRIGQKDGSPLRSPVEGKSLSHNGADTPV